MIFFVYSPYSLMHKFLNLLDCLQVFLENLILLLAILMPLNIKLHTIPHLKALNIFWKIWWARAQLFFCLTKKLNWIVFIIPHTPLLNRKLSTLQIVRKGLQCTPSENADSNESHVHICSEWGVIYSAGNFCFNKGLCMIWNKGIMSEDKLC